MAMVSSQTHLKKMLRLASKYFEAKAIEIDTEDKKSKIRNRKILKAFSRANKKRGFAQMIEG